MDGWKISRRIDLQENSPPVERLKTLATLSARQAHRLEITVLDGGMPADLTGWLPRMSIILPGHISSQKQLGSIQANVISAHLPRICYAETGDVSVILSLADVSGQTQIPIYGCVLHVAADSTDAVIDEEHVIPSISELLAQYNACRTATNAANAAASEAESKALLADNAAAQANTEAANASTAAKNANSAAHKLNGMTVSAKGLAPGEPPTALFSDDGEKYSIDFGIPRGNTGATPQITVRVKTGEPGSSASVEQSGTAENPIIDLTIPRGLPGVVTFDALTEEQKEMLKGDKGDKGDPGEPGKDGAKGDKGDPGTAGVTFDLVGTVLTITTTV